MSKNEELRLQNKGKMPLELWLSHQTDFNLSKTALQQKTHQVTWLANSTFPIRQKYTVKNNNSYDSFSFNSLSSHTKEIRFFSILDQQDSHIKWIVTRFPSSGTKIPFSGWAWLIGLLPWLLHLRWLGFDTTFALRTHYSKHLGKMKFTFKT